MPQEGIHRRRGREEEGACEDPRETEGVDGRRPRGRSCFAWLSRLLLVLSGSSLVPALLECPPPHERRRWRAPRGKRSRWAASDFLAFLSLRRGAAASSICDVLGGSVPAGLKKSCRDPPHGPGRGFSRGSARGRGSGGRPSPPTPTSGSAGRPSWFGIHPLPRRILSGCFLSRWPPPRKPSPDGEDMEGWRRRKKRNGKGKRRKNTERGRGKGKRKGKGKE